MVTDEALTVAHIHTLIFHESGQGSEVAQKQEKATCAVTSGGNQTPTSRASTHRAPSAVNKTPSRLSSASCMWVSHRTRRINAHFATAYLALTSIAAKRESIGSAPSTPVFDACVSNYKLKTAAELAKESPKPGSAYVPSSKVQIPVRTWPYKRFQQLVSSLAGQKRLSRRFKRTGGFPE